jgi:flagellar biosynthesis chaperone FliJ
MGVERAVTRWYALRQNIADQINVLEAKLQQQASSGAQERVTMEKELASLHARLRTLGPCPKPMMG